MACFSGRPAGPASSQDGMSVDWARKLKRLERKYLVLAGLKARREEMESAGATSFAEDESRARTAAFREVAREFPGALRELEHSDRGELEARLGAVRLELAELDKTPRGAAPTRGWVAVVLEYHDTLREALAIKMWLALNIAAPAPITEGDLRRFRAWHRSHDARHTPTAAFDRALLERYRRPPDGRLHSIVWERLGGIFGLSRRELERCVFSPPAGRRP
jgi:hypothetical protein